MIVTVETNILHLWLVLQYLEVNNKINIIKEYTGSMRRMCAEYAMTRPEFGIEFNKIIFLGKVR